MDMSHMQFYTTIAPMMETPQMNYQPTFTILPVQTDQKVCRGTKRAHPAVSQGSGPGKKRTTIKGGFTKPQTESVSKRNERERNRVKQVNMGFETLRQHVPSGAKNKKMSKVDTLRAAVDYIHQLQGILQDTDASIFETLGQDASWMQEPQIKCEQFSPSHSPVAAQHSPSHSADCMPSPGGYSSDGSANLSSTSQQPDLLDFSSWFQ